MKLDPSASVVDVADVLDSPGNEILVIDAQGVMVSALESGKYGAFKRVIERSAFVSAADPQAHEHSLELHIAVNKGGW